MISDSVLALAELERRDPEQAERIRGQMLGVLRALPAALAKRTYLFGNGWQELAGHPNLRVVASGATEELASRLADDVPAETRVSVLGGAQDRALMQALTRLEGYGFVVVPVPGDPEAFIRALGRALGVEPVEDAEVREILGEVRELARKA